MPHTELEPDVAFELMKLLMQVAWSDHELAPEEAEHMRNFAAELSLSAEQKQQLEGWADGSIPLAPPDIGQLRGARDASLRLAARIITADGIVHEDEEEMLKQIAAMLA